tara:strand:+ start:984 stop:1169 length:186 start_codon:yes stop_codon:yes gene_type:complete
VLSDVGVYPYADGLVGVLLLGTWHYAEPLNPMLGWLLWSSDSAAMKEINRHRNAFALHGLS